MLFFVTLGLKLQRHVNELKNANQILIPGTSSYCPNSIIIINTIMLVVILLASSSRRRGVPNSRQKHVSKVMQSVKPRPGNKLCWD